MFNQDKVMARQDAWICVSARNKEGKPKANMDGR